MFGLTGIPQDNIKLEIRNVLRENWKNPHCKKNGKG